MNRAAWTAIAIIAILLGVVAVVRFTQGPPQGSVDGQPPSEEPVTPFFRQGATDQPHSDDVRTPLTEAQQREMERIATLGYVAGTRPAGPRDGVVTHVPEATFPGYTLYTGGEGHEAFLIDLEGNIAHTWSYPGSKGWTRVRVMPNGDLFAITASPPKFLKLSRDSELLWSFEVHSHHDFTVLPDSTICVLVRGNTARRGLNHGRPVIDDHIVLLDKHGKELSFISLLKAFERSEFGRQWLIDHPPPDEDDIFHTNSVQPIQRDGRFQLLLSVRNIDTVAVLDVASGAIVWALAGRWHRQHEAQLLGDNLLLFDNLGPGREREGVEQSRVVEIDLSTGELVWSFTEPGFFTKRAGVQQRLPNGNTLITESEAGRVIEVTQDGRIVWEYINPKLVEDHPELRLGILRAERLSPGSVEGWLTR